MALQVTNTLANPIAACQEAIGVILSIEKPELGSVEVV